MRPIYDKLSDALCAARRLAKLDKDILFVVATGDGYYLRSLWTDDGPHPGTSMYVVTAYRGTQSLSTHASSRLRDMAGMAAHLVAA